MARTNFAQDREMLNLGYVAAPTACNQYGISRQQLLDLILDGKVSSRKPASTVYVLWSDMVKEMGKPVEYRAMQRGDIPEVGDLPLLEGMIPKEELEKEYKETAKKRGRPRGAKTASRPSSFVLSPGESNEDLE